MFKSSIRSFKNQPLGSFLLAGGLITGLTAFILVYLFVTMELSYDRFHENYHHICRLEQNFGGQGRLLAITHRPAGPALEEKYPEVRGHTRLRRISGKVILENDEQKEFSEDHGWYADPGFLKIFSFPLLAGDPVSVLEAPHSVVLTRRLSKKLFPGGEAIGKTVWMAGNQPLTVTGIAADCPENTHLEFSFLVSLSSLEQENGRGYLDQWERFDLYTYLLLSPGADAGELQEKMRSLLQERINETYPSFLTLKPLPDIHFHSDILLEPGPVGNIQKTWLYFSIGLFILLLACINFVNLSTARAVNRAREIGIRKASGAGRMALVEQFMGESLALMLFSFLLALLLTQLILPLYNRMIDRDLGLDILMDPWLTAGLAFLLLFIGILAGAYPALYLSSLEPVKAIRQQSHVASGKGLFRKILVTFQFVISALLISGTLILIKQSGFLRSKDLGYNRENILVLGHRPEGEEGISRFMTLTEEIRKMSGVESISVSQFIPNGTYGTLPVWFEGAAEGELADIGKNYIDGNFFETYRIELMMGENFIPGQPVDSLPPCIINEAAARRFRWDTILGRRVEFGRVAGVIRDFHYFYPGAEIAPLILYNVNHLLENPTPRNYNCSIRTVPGSEEKVFENLKRLYADMFPDGEPDLRYFEDDFQGMFTRDKKQTETFMGFSGLAVFIACLGLFGLSAFMARQRAREMAIRKVLGANGLMVMAKYLQGFLIWVVLANILAAPLSVYFMERWLQNFTFRTGIPFWIYLLTLALSLLITLVTIWFHAWKVSRQNPAVVLAAE